MAIFTYPVKILFQHCDPAGIVFYPRYFEMLNETVEIWFEDRLNCSFAKLHGEMALAVPTVHIEIDFQAASRHGDHLIFTLNPVRIGRSSLDIEIRATCHDQLRLVMKSRLVLISKATGRSIGWTKHLQKALQSEIRTAQTPSA